MRHYMITKNISQAHWQVSGICLVLSGLLEILKKKDFWSVPRYWEHALHSCVHSLAPNNHGREKTICSWLSFPPERFPIIYMTRASQTQPQWFLAHNMLTKCFQTSVRTGNHSGGEGTHSFQESRFFTIAKDRGHSKTSAKFKLHVAGTLLGGVRIWNSDKGKPVWVCWDSLWTDAVLHSVSWWKLSYLI